MFREIVSEKDFSVNVINKDRVFLAYKGEMVCKYSTTKDGIKDLLDDLVGIMTEMKIIKAKEQTSVRTKAQKAITNFAW